MKSGFSAILLLVMIVSPVLAQQPNTGTATMIVNGVTSFTYPILNVPLPRGLDQNVTVQGVPNAPFYLFAGPQLLTSGAPALGGLLDVDIFSGYVALMDGLANPAYVTDATGVFSTNIPLSSTATIGSSAAFQCVVADPTNVTHMASLTAASQCVVAQGLTVINLSVSGNGFQNVNLSTYGLNFPFYEQNYTSMWVNEDGSVTFNAGSGDFTPTPGELHSGSPRIAPQWTDLSVNYGGNVKCIINQSATAPQPVVRVEWNNMAEWNNSGGIHSFALELYPLVGDIEFQYLGFNNAMIYDELAGIAPGGNIFAQGSTSYSAQKDLSTMGGTPITGAPRESFWEWFGLVGMTYYTPTFNNPWDLTGSVRHFFAVGAGASGAYYIGT